MSRYDDYTSSTGTFDSGGGGGGGGGRWDNERFSRERQEREYEYTRRSGGGPPVMDRPPPGRRFVEQDDRFEFRLREVDDNRYAPGPPARRPDRYYEDEHLVYTSGPGPGMAGPLVTYDKERRRASRNISPPGGGGRPRLVRRQSSLDTFDRIPPRRRDPVFQDIPVRSARRSSPPPPASVRRSSPPPGTYYEKDYYEDIRIAEPDHYGDEEFRDLRETQQERRRRRSSSRGNNARSYREKIVEEIVEEKVEKAYPRKGKTRMPRRLVHPRAIDELGYPFIEEDDVIVIQKALSKDQIDEVISVSREIKRQSDAPRVTRSSPSPRREKVRETTYERLVLESPRQTRETLVVERSPSRPRRLSPIRYRDDFVEERTVREIRPRPRSVSVNLRRREEVSPVRIVERRDVIDSPSNLAIVVRPREDPVDDYIRDLEEERQLLRLERRSGGVDIIRQRDTEIADSNGDHEEILEVRKDRKSGPNPRIMRAMMATLT